MYSTSNKEYWYIHKNKIKRESTKQTIIYITKKLKENQPNKQLYSTKTKITKLYTVKHKN